MIPKSSVDIDKVISILKMVYTSEEEHTFLDLMEKMCWKESLDLKIKYDYSDIVDCLLYHTFRDSAIRAPSTIREPKSRMPPPYPKSYLYFDPPTDQILDELRAVLSIEKNEDLLPYVNSEYEEVRTIVKKRFEADI